MAKKGKGGERGKKRSGPPRKGKTRSTRNNERSGKGGSLPRVCVIDIIKINEDGEPIAKPAEWDGKKAPPFIVVTEKKGIAPGIGDRVLARMDQKTANFYLAAPIKKLPKAKPVSVLGVYRRNGDHGIIEPISRKEKVTYLVRHKESLDAQDGELVSGTSDGVTHRKTRMPEAKIEERLGTMESARAASLIAIHANELPVEFSVEAKIEATAAKAPVMEKGRTDLRDIPLVTIDGEDARDFDDAVFAEPDSKVKGGWHAIVAIADVAHYVTPGSALDAEAFERGNSAYFPDRVVPMLPEELSNGLCSLKPDEDRYCLAVHLWIDADGNTTRYQFERGLMRSSARLTYKKVEEVIESGKKHKQITPLHEAYQTLLKDREKRVALNINMPEYGIQLNEAGNVKAIEPKPRYVSHQLIELFMVAANVAAADFLLKNKAPGIYRVHETPSDEKLADLRHMLEHMGYRLSKGEGIRPQHFNVVLKKAEGKPDEMIVQQSVLRAQMQAFYSEKNLGHFGLQLQKYAHFTSPIRRYADLVVHRSIINILSSSSGASHATGDLSKRSPTSRGEVEDDGKQESLENIAEHISQTERKAMLAERDAMDRYRASFMVDKIGEHFKGTITGALDAGLFITLPGTGVTGFCPVRMLEGDFFHFDPKRGELRGRRTRQVFATGDAIEVRVEEANPLTGNLIFTPAGTKPSRPLTKKSGKPKKRRDDKEKKTRRRKRT